MSAPPGNTGIGPPIRHVDDVDTSGRAGPVEAVVAAIRYTRERGPCRVPPLSSLTVALLAESLLQQGVVFPNGAHHEVGPLAELGRLYADVDQVCARLEEAERQGHPGSDADHERRGDLDREIAAAIRYWLLPHEPEPDQGPGQHPPEETSVSTVHLYAFAAPAHQYALYIAPRPLPGRLLGTAAGMVHDVGPEYVEPATRLDAQRITLITPAGLERLAEQLLANGSGYTRADYEEAGVWDAEQIARDRGHALLTITPSPNAGPLVSATAADDDAAGLADPARADLKYVTLTLVLRADGDPTPRIAEILAGQHEVMWFGTEMGVTAAARDGGAEPGDWPTPTC